LAEDNKADDKETEGGGLVVVLLCKLVSEAGNRVCLGVSMVLNPKTLGSHSIILQLFLIRVAQNVRWRDQMYPVMYSLSVRLPPACSSERSNDGSADKYAACKRHCFSQDYPERIHDLEFIRELQ
jgi:hypothetical protein